MMLQVPLKVDPVQTGGIQVTIVPNISSPPKRLGGGQEAVEEEEAATKGKSAPEEAGEVEEAFGEAGEYIPTSLPSYRPRSALQSLPQWQDWQTL